MNHKNQIPQPNFDDFVYISYAQNDRQYPHVGDIVYRFVDLFKQLNIKYRIDTENDGKNIYDFICEFESAKNIIVILSDKYFRSRNCMIEWINVQNNYDVNKKVIYIKYDEEAIILNDGSILTNGFDLTNDLYLSLLKTEWQKKQAKWHNQQSDYKPSEIEKRNAKDDFYVSSFSKIKRLISNSTCYKTSELNAEFKKGGDVTSHSNLREIISIISRGI